MAIKKIVDGNYAASYTSYVFTEVAGIYPITPSSQMAENVDKFSTEGRLNAFGSPVRVVEMQSEAGAAGMVHGVLQGGSLATTFTSSQGLLLMIPNMYKMAGEMLPSVIHVAARSISTHALSIMGDHQDIYAARQTGYAILASSSVQDAALLSAVAHLSSIKTSIPFIHFFDGFRTSHELSNVILLEDEELKGLIDKDAVAKFRDNALNPKKPVTRGTAQNDDVYFQATEVRNKYYSNVYDEVLNYMNKINDIAGTDYKPFKYYGCSSAKSVIVSMGSVSETIKETIDVLNETGEEYGLLEVHLFRPFAIDKFVNELPESVKKVAVLDRTKEHGSSGEPLYLDVKNALNDTNIKVIGGRYGLSSKNTTPSQIKAVFDNLNSDMKNSFTIGIDDDVTNLSLECDKKFKISRSCEYLIYGYGSDGMVSASKNIIKTVGETTGLNVQGYFQYDSKKSGSVTVGHLRFSKDKIRSTYYVDNPSLVVCTKESYLNKYDIISSIKKDGVFILNTSKNENEILNTLDDNVKIEILEKNIDFYVIDADKISDKLGIKGKLSTIFESVILSKSELLNYDDVKEKLKDLAQQNFNTFGAEVVIANQNAIEISPSNLKKVEIPKKDYVLIKEYTPDNVVDAMNKRMGDKLKVSAFLESSDGTFEGGNTKYEKRSISEVVPCYDKENCIQCNLCALACPHGVIRPFLLNEEEVSNASENVKDKLLEPMDKDHKEKYKYTISVSINDCTGCSVCANVCPGKKGNKALSMVDINSQIENQEDKRFDYLFNKVSEKEDINIQMVKGTQFRKPKFEFSGACAGCGETPYIKLLTQLFGDNMIIANATGCSSIYGGSAPSTPYTVPWASSLFEDNAEFGYGILVANSYKRTRLENLVRNSSDDKNKEVFEEWLEKKNDFEEAKKIYEKIDFENADSDIKELKDHFKKRSIWSIGGDGWAYDIGFGGIDHVLASGENINILVLDTEVYSNTGGQTSKATKKGSIAAFSADGKKTNSKDLARMALTYPNVYVAQINMGANPNQTLKALREAEAYDGPSIIIAFSPCISHGIKGGLAKRFEYEKEATQTGYFPIFRYNPDLKKFDLDFKKPDFEKYHDFLMSQKRFKVLEIVNKENASRLLEENKENAIERFEYYKKMSEGE